MASALKPLTRSPKSIAKLINLSSRSSRLLIRIIHSLNVLPLIQIFLRVPFASTLSSLSSLIPSFISFLPHLFVSLLILNSRSLPFTWTFRVLWCVIKVRTRYSAAWARVWARYWMRYSKKLVQGVKECSSLTTFSRSELDPSNNLTLDRKKEHGETKQLDSIRRLRIREMELWLESVTPVGAHPFEWEGSYATWVGFDDSDFNMHMSNSSYPKVLDFARTKASLELFPQFLRVGGHVALSSTHFQFIQEIPLFSRYQILTSIGAWDEKWCYLIFRFVTIENKYKKNQHSSSANVPRILITPPELNKHHSPDPVHFPLSSNLHHSQSGVNLNSHPTVPDSKLHTIAVSRICFKVGRITVPPAIVFTTNGMSMHPWEVCTNGTEKGMASSLSSPSPFAVAKFSHNNPPPSWTEHGLYLIAKTHSGDEAKLREFYRGAWRNTEEATDGKDMNKSGTVENSTVVNKLSGSLSENKLALDDPSIWKTRSILQSQDIDLDLSSPTSLNSPEDSSNGSDTESDSDSASAAATPPTPSTPPTIPSSYCTPIEHSHLIAPKLTEWWDLAMGIGTPADETRKARLEVCRMLVGGMEGIKEMC
ncbi:hypothetical protein DFJ43DRAFT_635279 [Lentinula guzmanii]|uniref:Thioesterase/thiol ester dehydrase-isomerase n=1 Tax=Lentinula guzmanii TaxID=2804957 RepID=A0AA38MS74_9AGAR|nr:hypothetical protein DFJ43DRAFT_635279 [Lentinula guzmanii]